MKRKILKIKDIVIDRKLYPREKVINKIVSEYAQDMVSGDVFPPIFVAFYKGKLILLDGRHRLEAHVMNGHDFIQGEVQSNFRNLEDMFLASVKSNLKHGLRYSEKSRNLIAYRLREMSIDVDDIAKLTGIKIQRLETIYSKKLKHIFIKDKIKNGKMPTLLREKVKPKEDVKIVDNSVYESDEYITYELENIYDFFKKKTLNISDKHIVNNIKKIKRTLNKKFPKL